MDAARSDTTPARAGRTASAGPRNGTPTAFSQLDSEEKDAFRTWSGITAPRIADAKVHEWLSAGKPSK